MRHVQVARRMLFRGSAPVLLAWYAAMPLTFFLGGPGQPLRTAATCLAVLSLAAVSSVEKLPRLLVPIAIVLWIGLETTASLASGLARDNVYATVQVSARSVGLCVLLLITGDTVGLRRFLPADTVAALLVGEALLILLLVRDIAFGIEYWTLTFDHPRIRPWDLDNLVPLGLLVELGVVIAGIAFAAALKRVHHDLTGLADRTCMRCLSVDLINRERVCTECGARQ